VNPDVDCGVEGGSQHRAGHDVGGRPGRDDASGAEEDDMVGDPCGGVEVVHADDAREVVASGEVDEEIALLEAMAHIEESAGLVEQEHARTGGQGAGDGDAPLLAAAEGVDGTAFDAAEVTPGDGLVDGGAVVGPFTHPAALMRRASHRDDLPHGEPRRGHLALGDVCELPRGGPSFHPAHVLPRDAHGPRRRREEARRDAKERRLAGSVRSQQRRDLACPDGQADVFERRGCSGVVVARRDTVELDARPLGRRLVGREARFCHG